MTMGIRSFWHATTCIDCSIVRVAACRPAFAWACIIAVVSCSTLAVFVNRQLPSNYDPSPPYTSAFLIMETLSALLCMLEIVMRISSARHWQHLLSSAWLWVCGVSTIPLVVYMVRSQLCHSNPLCLCTCVFVTVSTPQVSWKHMNLFEWTAIRLLFISRVLMAVPRTRASMQACQHTVQQSARLLYMLLFLATLALLINSSVLYYLERGTYSELTQVRGHVENVGALLWMPLMHNEALPAADLDPKIRL